MLKTCEKCKTTGLRFQVKLEAIVDAIVDEKGNIIKELKIERKGKKYGARYICVVCGKEYTKLEPLMAHVR